MTEKVLEKDKVECTECSWRGLRVELDEVTDPNPKPQTTPDRWCVCPNCRTPEQIVSICDEPGCDRRATCGVPTDAGYRCTCGPHAPW